MYTFPFHFPSRCIIFSYIYPTLLVTREIIEQLSNGDTINDTIIIPIRSQIFLSKENEKKKGIIFKIDYFSLSLKVNSNNLNNTENFTT